MLRAVHGEAVDTAVYIIGTYIYIHCLYRRLGKKRSTPLPAHNEKDLLGTLARLLATFARLGSVSHHGALLHIYLTRNPLRHLTNNTYM